MKYRIIFAIVITSLLLVSCKKDDTDNAKSSGKLYVRSLYSIVTGIVSIDWYYMGEHGGFVKNPKNGVQPVNIEAEKNNNRQNTGTYSLYKSNGNSFIMITWSSGDLTTMGLKYENGDIVEMDIMGIMMRQTGLTKSLKLNGTYNGASTDLSFHFSTDGSFTFKDFNFDTNTWETYPGNYEIVDNNLKLKFDDGLVLCLIAVLDDGNLIINREYYEKQ